MPQLFSCHYHQHHPSPPKRMTISCLSPVPFPVQANVERLTAGHQGPRHSSPWRICWTNLAESLARVSWNAPRMFLSRRIRGWRISPERPFPTGVQHQAQMLMGCWGMMFMGSTGRANGGDDENYLTWVDVRWHFNKCQVFWVVTQAQEAKACEWLNTEFVFSRAQRQICKKMK